MVPRLRFFFRQALRAMARSLGVTSLAILTIGVSLAVLATFAVAVDNLRRLASELGDEVAVSAYLDPDTTSGEAIAAEAARWVGVRRAFVLTSSAAMSEFKAQLGEDAVLLEGLPAEVIPASVEVLLEDRPWTVAEVGLIADRLASRSGVADVRYGQDEVERVSSLLGVARIAAFVLGVALCFATILIIYNTIRLTLYARRDEIEIMSLVGATASFVRAPFVLEGAIQGILGGFASVGALLAVEEALVVGLERGLSFARGSGVELELISPSFYLGLVLAGAGLGIVGSVLAVGKFLRL